VAAVEFDVALFTNLSRDHLEYHRTLRRYGAAKARLFAWETLRHAVVNLDDDFGAALARRIRRPGLKVIGYGFGATRGAPVARVTGSNLVTSARGVSFDAKTPWGTARVTSPVLGRHNAYNLLGTLAVLLASGVTLRQAVAALSALKPVPGRLQRLGGGPRPLVVVDYAHTPDALRQALTTLRELLDSHDPRPTTHESRLICVFGCGGDRDRGKRPQMGRVAAALADRVVVTSDNPRGEDPRRIIDDIVGGVRGAGGGMVIEPDRRAAILHAVQEARRGDIVLLAGKGHETYQEIRGARRPFSDAAVAQEAVARR
jgi:UDP-N-acetylmuramoyl-L-alanyl-D-glutamate--2,6-diaminopimelate ligase